MAKDSAILETPEKLGNQIETVEAMKQLIVQKKMEFEAIQGQIRQYKTQIITLQEKLRIMESESIAKLNQEKAKFEKERQGKLNEFSNREEKINKGENDLRERLTTVSQREFTAERIHEERKKLMDEMVKYENLNKEAQLKYGEAVRLENSSKDKLDLVVKKDIDAEKKFAEVKNAQSIIETDRQDLINREQDLIKQKENLEKLRNEISPQIEEYKATISKSESVLKEIKLREEEIDKKLEQDNALLATLDDKQRKIQMKEIDISSREQDLIRKEIIYKNK